MRSMYVHGDGVDVVEVASKLNSLASGTARRCSAKPRLDKLLEHLPAAEQVQLDRRIPNGKLLLPLAPRERRSHSPFQSIPLGPATKNARDRAANISHSTRDALDDSFKLVGRAFHRDVAVDGDAYAYGEDGDVRVDC